MTPDPTLIELTPSFKAMSPLQKWETLVLSGLIGTDEPWIEDMRQALREQEATLQGSAALPSADEVGQLIEDVLFPLFGAGPYEALAAKIVAMRATTPTAPDDGLFNLQLSDETARELEALETARRSGAARSANFIVGASTAPVQDDDAEIAKTFAEMLFHADGISRKPTAPNEVETTLITTRESRLLRQFLERIASRLSPTPETDQLDTDLLIVKMLHELHAHLPEDQRPMAMCDLSDEQAERARKAVNAVVVAACLSKPAGHHASIAELEAAISTPETGLVEALRRAIESERRKWFCSGADCKPYDHGRDEGFEFALNAFDAALSNEVKGTD